MAHYKRFDPPPRHYWPPTERITLTAEQAEDIRMLMRLAPWTQRECELNAQRVPPSGEARGAYADWERQLGLPVIDLLGRLEGRWSELPGERHLNRQLNGEKSLPAGLLALICEEVGTTIGQLLGASRPRPAYLDDFLSVIEKANELAPSETRKLIEAVEPLVQFWRHAIWHDEAQAQTLLSEIAATTNRIVHSWTRRRS